MINVWFQIFEILKLLPRYIAVFLHYIVALHIIYYSGFTPYIL